jgi:hypothetical protein
VHVIRSVNEKQEREDLECEQMPKDGGDEIGLSLEKELLLAPVLKVPMPEDAPSQRSAIQGKGTHQERAEHQSNNGGIQQHNLANVDWRLVIFEEDKVI